MDVAGAVEMLLFDPEHALHLTVFVHPVPERPVMGLEIVPGPGAPAGEFALGFDVNVGTLGECSFGELVHGIWPSIAGLQPLNPIRARCANADPDSCRRKALDRAEMRPKRPFRSAPIFLLRDPMNEPQITPELVASHGLKPDEYERILKLIGRVPSFTELGIFSAMWNEHCSYKSSRLHLRGLPTKAPWVIQGPGENAGVIDIGDGQA